MPIVLAALWGSFWVKVTGAIFLVAVAFWGWGTYQRSVGEAVGEAVISEKVEKVTAKAAAKGAEIRAHPDTGRRGGKNPYLRAD
jgi:uncharacterized membrane protein YbhN (UPF0104 family)